MKISRRIRTWLFNFLASNSDTAIVCQARNWVHFLIELLHAENMTWHDIVRTSNYLRDIERDYKEFNKIRTTFFDWLGLDPLPASTGIQARLCWETLLVEIEAIAVCPIR